MFLYEEHYLEVNQMYLLGYQQMKDKISDKDCVTLFSSHALSFRKTTGVKLAYVSHHDS